ncbi:MAG TPA: hypothetical protein VIG73_10655 [Cerasibacillus sp.]|uniref:hypothetical protein n=1 Tax=Cerasibacillus sp. TaxID=2498711 RepID=UPI002F4268A1
MDKQKALYLSLLFILYIVIGVVILFLTDFTPLLKIALFITLIFLTHFFKKIIKTKTIDS